MKTLKDTDEYPQRRTPSFYRVLNLLGLLISGIFIGFFGQRLADSGEVYADRVAIGCLITTGSYILPYFVLLVLRSENRIEWLLSVVSGSILAAFSVRIVVFTVINWEYRNQDSVSAMTTRLFATTVTYLIISLGLVATVRFVGFGVRTLITKSNT